MVTDLSYSLQGLRDFRCAHFLIIYDFSFTVEIECIFTLELSVSEVFLNTSVSGWCWELLSNRNPMNELCDQSRYLISAFKQLDLSGMKDKC